MERNNDDNGRADRHTVLQQNLKHLDADHRLYDRSYRDVDRDVEVREYLSYCRREEGVGG